MAIDPVRFKRQKELALQWITEANGMGTLEAVTGFGKTMVARVAERLVRNRENDPHTVIVVPSLALKDQWEEIAKDSFFSYEIWTVQSLYKYKGTIECSFLIADEIHMYEADQFKKIFYIVVPTFTLGLTATLEGSKIDRKTIAVYAPIFARVDLDEALKYGWISEYRVYNIGIWLDARTKTEYDSATTTFGKNISLFKDFDHMLACMTQKQTRIDWAEELTDNGVGEFDERNVYLCSTAAFNGMKKRKKLLYEYDAKVKMAADIARSRPDRNIIVFGQSIMTAERVSTFLGDKARAYHSKVKGEIINGKKRSAKFTKARILEDFCKPGVNPYVLATAKALDMGIDIPMLDTGIVIAGTSKSLTAIQRLGRIVRKQEDKFAIWIELYCLDSQDEKWLFSRQQGIPRHLIHYIRSPKQIEWPKQTTNV